MEIIIFIIAFIDVVILAITDILLYILLFAIQSHARVTIFHIS
jgi:hypothetical protein